MVAKKNRVTISDMATTLLDTLSQAYTGSYAKAHPEIQRAFLQQAKRLQAHEDDRDVYYQVKRNLRKIILDLSLDGGVKEIDPSLQSLGRFVTHIDDGSVGRAAGGWAAMLPIWFGGTN